MADECETHGETDCTVRLTLHGSAETDAYTTQMASIEKTASKLKAQEKEILKKLGKK